MYIYVVVPFIVGGENSFYCKRLRDFRGRIVKTSHLASDLVRCIPQILSFVFLRYCHLYISDIVICISDILSFVFL